MKSDKKKRVEGKPWWVFVSHQGKRKSMKIGDKRSAEKVAIAVRRKLAKGTLNISRKKELPKPTFGEYSKKWLDGYVEINLRESTFNEYEGILRNHVLPLFKKEKIDSISRGEVRYFLLSKYGV